MDLATKTEVTKETYCAHLTSQIEEIRSSGLFKAERVLTTPQEALIATQSTQDILNLCANNYLGLSNHPELIKAAHETLENYGYGLSSVRFICGTQDIHKELEARLSAFLGTEDTILYSSCFDANGGLFETLLTDQDAVISDELNHASIIDGIRLCKAQRLRYKNNDMNELEARLQEAQSARFRLIATDGVFSMDGIAANLPAICDLAEKYNALVMVDDSHATGFVGSNGRGTHEALGVMGRVTLLTGTLGKALGGGSGGYISGPKEIIAFLRQRSRPYLFSNSVPPVVVGTSLKALELVAKGDDLREKLRENMLYFRSEMERLGFNLVPGSHPIIPVMLGDAKIAVEMASRLLDEGIYVISFSYPVVPKGKARIRTQISAAHNKEHLEKAVKAFEKVGKELGVIS